MSERYNQIRPYAITMPSRQAYMPTSSGMSFDNRASEKFSSFENHGRREELVNDYTTTPRLTNIIYDSRKHRRGKEVYDH